MAIACIVCHYALILPSSWIMTNTGKLRPCSTAKRIYNIALTILLVIRRKSPFVEVSFAECYAREKGKSPSPHLGIFGENQPYAYVVLTS
jgi:hypothetical protein